MKITKNLEDRDPLLIKKKHQNKIENANQWESATFNVSNAFHGDFHQ